MDSDLESKLILLIAELRRLHDLRDQYWESKITPLCIHIISVVISKYLGDPQPKPESKLMSLITQTVSLFNSMDFDSMPKPLSELISLISKRISIDSNQVPESDLKFKSLVDQTLKLKPVPELVSLIRQIVSVAISMNLELKKYIIFCPQVQGYFNAERTIGVGRIDQYDWKWDIRNCFLEIFGKFSSKREEGITYLWCRGCSGEYHKEYEKAPIKIKHPLHLKHTLQLVFNKELEGTRECHCCDEYLRKIFYGCLTCDYAMNIACTEKSPLQSIPNSKWHEHPLSLFPRKTSLTCNVCALADSRSPIYMCPSCDFVVHLKCIKIPRVIRISRHSHRIYHTLSFDEEDRSCGVCHRKIDNDYAGYSCIKEGCYYAVHSKCATQRNVWDGIDLEGEPEEIEEEIVEPFVRISDGIIRHFSHEHHHLRLDENTCRDYDENKQCQACVTPIYFGNFYSCMQCDFILHETCANLSRKMYCPIHPHLLTLSLVGDRIIQPNICFGCYGYLAAGFFYECSKEECNFKLHVQCATISEPLVHQSHVHPLYQTSKPGEKRTCCACKGFSVCTKDTFNCLECDHFALCFKCAILPQKVRYMHDKHIFILSYKEETSNGTYWCEACESEIYSEAGLGFYVCDEYCCVALHKDCLIGTDLYMKPGSSFSYNDKQVGVLPNNHMSRPICRHCKKRCSQKVFFQSSGSIFCSLACSSLFGR